MFSSRDDTPERPRLVLEIGDVLDVAGFEALDEPVYWLAFGCDATAAAWSLVPLDRFPDRGLGEVHPGPVAADACGSAWLQGWVLRPQARRRVRLAVLQGVQLRKVGQIDPTSASWQATIAPACAPRPANKVGQVAGTAAWRRHFDELQRLAALVLPEG